MMYGNGFFNHSLCFGNGFYGGWHLMMVAAILILGVVLFVLARKKHSSSQGDEILSMLKEKFVKGDITEEEYLSRKNILTRK